MVISIEIFTYDYVLELMTLLAEISLLPKENPEFSNLFLTKNKIQFKTTFSTYHPSDPSPTPNKKIDPKQNLCKKNSIKVTIQSCVAQLQVT